MAPVGRLFRSKWLFIIPIFFVESGLFCNFADMDKDTYEKNKAFAGEKKASMKRRFVGHDYTRRGILYADNDR